MINSHFESIQKIISNEPLIIGTTLNQNYTSVNTAYIKGELTFADGSKLVLFQHIRIHGTELVMTDYRYQYMTDDNELIFRYDNAPHHPEITTCPHHKHLSSGVHNANMPDLNYILEETKLSVINKLL